MNDSTARSARRASWAPSLVRWRERLIGTLSLIFPNHENPSSPGAWEKGSHVLLYHRIVEDSGTCLDPFAVRCSNFKSQMVWLSQKYTMLSTRELVRRLMARESIYGTAAITIDDGLSCVSSCALRILKMYGIPATVFIDTDRLDRSASSLSSKQVCELSADGIEIGSHGVSHVDMRTLSDRELLDELIRSREILSALIGKDINGFAYPFGKFDERVIKFVRQAGYEYACTCRQHRSNHIGDDPYSLNRIEINLDDSQSKFQDKIAGRFASVYAMWYRINPYTRSWLT